MSTPWVDMWCVQQGRMSLSNVTVNNADNVDKTAFHISGDHLLLTYLMSLVLVVIVMIMLQCSK